MNMITRCFILQTLILLCLGWQEEWGVSNASVGGGGRRRVSGQRARARLGRPARRHRLRTPTRLESTRCLNRQLPHPGRVADSILSLLQSVEGQEGWSASSLRHACAGINLEPAALSRAEQEPSAAELERVEVLAQIAAVAWVFVNDQIAVEKWGWCHLEMLSDEISGSSASQVGRQLERLRPVLYSVRDVVQDFVYSMRERNYINSTKESVKYTPYIPVRLQELPTKRMKHRARVEVSRQMHDVPDFITSKLSARDLAAVESQVLVGAETRDNHPENTTTEIISTMLTARATEPKATPEANTTETTTTGERSTLAPNSTTPRVVTAVMPDVASESWVGVELLKLSQCNKSARDPVNWTFIWISYFVSGYIFHRSPLFHFAFGPLKRLTDKIVE